MWCCAPTIDSEMANVLPYAERTMTYKQATASTTSTASTASDTDGQQSLEESLLRFRARALATDPLLKEALPEVRKWHWKGSQVVLTACDFVEGFLRGLEAHLPDVQVATQLIENQSSSVTLQVQLLNSVQATIATRSRIGYDVLLKDEASFTLSHQKGDSDRQEVRLEINGLEFWPLEDSAQLRKKLRELLGDDFSRTSVYQWWEEHKEEAPQGFSAFSGPGSLISWEFKFTVFFL
eukprot:s4495_g1.t1